jgi:hypothetical protein
VEEKPLSKPLISFLLVFCFKILEQPRFKLFAGTLATRSQKHNHIPLDSLYMIALWIRLCCIVFLIWTSLASIAALFDYGLVNNVRQTRIGFLSFAPRQ